MHKDNLKICFPSATEYETQQRFYDNFAAGLHALAQPLTVLRSAMMASSLPGLSAVDQRRYVDLSAEQVERTCGLFQNLQQLLNANREAAECLPVNLVGVLWPAVEHQRTVLHPTGVQIDASIPDDLPNVLGDMDRTLQAFFNGFKIAASLSEPGDVIELRVAPWNEYVELSIRNHRSHGRRLNSTERFNLALAETNIRSQNGMYECTEDPFHFSLALPVLNPSRKKLDHIRSEAAPQRMRVHSFQ
jgi:hypothetical protein